MHALPGRDTMMFHREAIAPLCSVGQPMAELIHRLGCIPIQLLPIRQSSLLLTGEKILCCFVLPFRKSDLSVSRLEEVQYFCLENPMYRGAWQAEVHGVVKSWIRLSDFTFTFHFHALEKEMATHSSILAWRVPGMAEPGGLPSMGSHRVGHD